MIDNLPFAASTVAVLGLGRSGLAAARALLASDAEVWAWDDSEEVRARASEVGVPLVDLGQCDWDEPEVLVLSPGIPHSFPAPHPVVEKARGASCEIIGDTDLLARAQKEAAYIGITGTNGKSTATALLGHILHAAGREAEIGGNLGIPVLELRPLGADGVYVLEMSSFQLELTPSLSLQVAVLLNISPDHLDRHGSMQGYIAAKESIFRRRAEQATAVIGIDDEHCRDIYDKLLASGGGRIIPVSCKRHAEGGVYVLEGVLYDAMDGAAAAVLELSDIVTLPGRHNWQNAAAAYAAAKAAGVASRTISAAIRSYPGLAHRQERIATLGGIGFVNDSKATNPAAAAKALSCYGAIYWIAGGHAKEGGLDELLDSLDAVRHAFLIGEAEDVFAEALGGKTPFSKCGDLATAVEKARRLALKENLDGAVVLLSPACSSFDQFRNFEHRGDAFRALVNELVAENEGRR